jgi:hypothetical protein
MKKNYRWCWREIKQKYHCCNFFLCQNLKSRISIKFKQILDILLRDFSLSSCLQHSLKFSFLGRVGGVGWDWVHLVRRPLIGLLYQSRVTDDVGQSVEWELAGGIEVLGENPPQCHFVHHKSYMTWSGSNPGRRGGKPATNHLRYGAAFYSLKVLLLESFLLLNPMCLLNWVHKCEQNL